MDLIGTSEFDISAPPEAVWAVLACVECWKVWMPGVRWAVLEGALERGAYVTIKPDHGRQTAYRVDVADAAVALALGLTFGPLASLRLTFALIPRNAATCVVYTAQTAGPLRMLLVAKRARRAHADARLMLEGLKAAACARIRQ